MVTKECRQILFYILDSILHILYGAHAPSNHDIGEDSLIQLGTQLEVCNLDGTLLHLEVFIQIYQWGARVIIHT
jgi:hypothetical protein